MVVPAYDDSNYNNLSQLLLTDTGRRNAAWKKKISKY
jgi:hypothetical protein